MKCVCGYEHKSGMDDRREWQENLVGDEPFVRLQGSIFETEDSWDSHRVHLCFCPKCKTVRTEE